MDVKSVDIVAGASSAFYGPGAFNGVVSMETKSPFQFPGITVSTKVGERELNELAFRYADYTTDDDGNPVLGFKVNAYRFRPTIGKRPTTIQWTVRKSTLPTPVGTMP